ncbi:predicted ATPase of the PP-loop superfamily implicated in cell cycle control [Caldanaerobacter subterraneus subsp. tengcongensis MB4]|uniref:tRNA(Ile)-lysidine synthase n=2 Tax=Caldanaerobacter subterraneus TaxID=911092 RepID=TILS_CALS4|nr:RecName: Full=tRNA(Ile)-lysidine synthase; AltName: Full=tRNA(Ile)-2-lysyl-cytidine synthase; AltName: Full=tRNA(Ile)-lysidine synthetase [Caldanaerobacter subterraneus subsp. tengcongensis MB4]AAM25534.1 predicted ATPase of the PP-loop superfamily implicated in cell cycle control [Caldanaerobacter subterraneus subsp. tengcongensis MB4]
MTMSFQRFGMIEKVLRTIEKYNMIEKDDKIVMGISGGPDSLCMLDVLFNLKGKFNLKLYVVHVNHMIRGEDAKKDAEFVEKLCKDLDLPFFLFEENIPYLAKKMGLSEEQAGRYVRYKAFEETLKRVGGNKIAVAHNKNDVAETVLLNILRGTGLRGLIGIKPVNGNIIRPLIEIERREIEKYLKDKNLHPRIDHTNYEDLYTRNKIRLKVIPYIEEVFKIDLVENLSRMAAILLEEDDYLEAKCEEVFNQICEINGEEIKVDVDALKSQHTAIKRRLVRRMYFYVKGETDGLEYGHVEDVLNLLDKPTSSKIDLPFEIEALKMYNNLVIRKKKTKEKVKFKEVLKIPGVTTIEGIGKFKAYVVDISQVDDFNKGEYIKFFDYDKIKGEIVVKSREDGDRFSPLGMRGTKKLKEFFIDEKIPREERDYIPLVAIGKEIVWVVGYRMSEKFKVDKNTSKVLVIEYTKE